jgi:hypothetical protein
MYCARFSLATTADSAMSPSRQRSMAAVLHLDKRKRWVDLQAPARDEGPLPGHARRFRLQALLPLDLFEFGARANTT